MKSYHPDASVEISRSDIESLRDQHTGADDGDAHILATVIIGDADILATDNTKDFILAEQWMQDEHSISLIDHGQLLAMLFTEYPEFSVDVHRFLLTGQYAEKGQGHMFSTMRRATKQADIAISALEQSLTDLDDYESDVEDIAQAMTVAFYDAKQNIAEGKGQAQQRLGTVHVVWVGA